MQFGNCQHQLDWRNEMPNTKSTRAFQLQLILESYAPRERDRQDCRYIYAKMVENNVPATTIEKQIINALSEGMRFGNWPWVR